MVGRREREKVKEKGAAAEGDSLSNSFSFFSILKIVFERVKV